jgi:competence protein ComGF
MQSRSICDEISFLIPNKHGKTNIRLFTLVVIIIIIIIIIIMLLKIIMQLLELDSSDEITSRELF